MLNIPRGQRPTLRQEIDEILSPVKLSDYDAVSEGIADCVEGMVKKEMDHDNTIDVRKALHRIGKDMDKAIRNHLITPS